PDAPSPSSSTPQAAPPDTSTIEVLRRPVESTQYTSIKLTTRLLKAGIEASMGTVGDSFDNALAENFWSVLK
ncbi:hypothetical protein ACIOJE_34885, partial [Kitasatospora sp. NPDC087861]